MSKKKYKKQSRTGCTNNNQWQQSIFQSIEHLIASLIIDPIVSLLCRVKSILISFFIIVMPQVIMNAVMSSEKLSSKKQARLLNKQSKMMAEYRLMTEGGSSGDGEEGQPPGKKIKLEADEADNSGGRKLLSPEEFKQMKLELAERKRMLTQLPRFQLTTQGIESTIHSVPYNQRTPLMLADIQHLITYAYGGNTLVTPPSRWCTLQKPNRLVQIVLLVVDGLGLHEFMDNEHLFSRTMGVFGSAGGESDPYSCSSNRCVVEVLDPQWYGSSLESEVRGWGFDETPGGDGDDGGSDNFEAVLKQLSSVFNITGSETSATPKTNEDKFPRTQLLLSLPQLIQETYPLPIPSNPITRATDVKFVPTSETYAPVTRSSPMFAIDCEMCGAVGDLNALVKIAIVDEELKTVYESLVRPKTKIMDYRTKWSGITSEMLEGVEVRLRDVQKRVKELVKEHPDCILVGQSLNCDLRSLRMIHPYVIDTSVCFNLTGIEGRKNKLRDLAWNLLDEVIQGGKHQKKHNNNDNDSGHCPVEDAVAAMKLIKAKLANDITFGNALKKNTGDQPTVVAAEPTVVQKLNQYFKEKKSTNALDKNVLIINHTPPISTTSAAAGSSSDEEEELSPSSSKKVKQTVDQQQQQQPNQSQNPASSSDKIKVLSSPSNRSTVRLLKSHVYDSFLSIGYYKINSSKDVSKEYIKFDKRVQKLYNKLCDNSLMVIVGGSSSGVEDVSKDGGGGDAKNRRNNCVCFVKVKVNSEFNRRRRDN